MTHQRSAARSDLTYPCGCDGESCCSEEQRLYAEARICWAAYEQQPSQAGHLAWREAWQRYRDHFLTQQPHEHFPIYTRGPLIGYQCRICGVVSGRWPFDLLRERQLCGHLTRWFHPVAQHPCPRCSWLCWPQRDGSEVCRWCAQHPDQPPRALPAKERAEVERCYPGYFQAGQSVRRAGVRRLAGQMGGLALVLLALWAASVSSAPTLAAPLWTSASLLVPTPTSRLSRTPVCPTLRPDATFGVSLIDVATGQPLCERNANGIAQPASTTKVMAALLVGTYLQTHHLSLATPVTVQPADLQIEPDAAAAGLRVGQRYSVRLLLAMTAILSAADAVMALARFVAGSRPAFLALMNQQARALGMIRTHFSSPYGYARTKPGNWQQGESPTVGNYASAHDLAVLMVAFVRFPALVAIFGLEHDEEAGWILDRRAGEVLPDFWGPLSLPFRVLAAKKGCMWCNAALHKLSYVLLIRAGDGQEIAAAFLYTTQSISNARVGDVLATLLWALHACRSMWARWC